MVCVFMDSVSFLNARVREEIFYIILIILLKVIGRVYLCSATELSVLQDFKHWNFNGIDGLLMFLLDFPPFRLIENLCIEILAVSTILQSRK